MYGKPLTCDRCNTKFPNNIKIFSECIVNFETYTRCQNHSSTSRLTFHIACAGSSQITYSQYQVFIGSASTTSSLGHGR